MAGARWGLGMVVGAGLLASGACSEAFSNDCTATRSCSLPSEAGEGGSETSEPVAGSTSAGGTNGNANPDGVAGAGGEATGPCLSHADCSNDDPSDGEELCEAGECQPGDAPPRVVSITPDDGDDEVESDVTVSVEFSEPLDPDTVTPKTFKVFAGEAGETEVAGTLKLSTGREQLRFAPDERLDLWGRYRVEISRELADDAGMTMLDDFSASFRVRDGVWAIASVGEADSFQLPNEVPVSSQGALVTAWLATLGSGCKASGAWVLRGQSTVSQVFAAAPISACDLISADIAPDGTAVVGWNSGDKGWSQSFAMGSWSAAERETYYNAATRIANASVFAHADEQMSIFTDVRGRSSWIGLETGAARGAWLPTYHSGQKYFGSATRSATAQDGSIAMVTTTRKGVWVIEYRSTEGWGTESVPLPGTDEAEIDRTVASIARSPEGTRMIAWIEGDTSKQVLKASRFDAETGWESAPADISTGLKNAPLFDAPALVFDGETFVTAWTTATGGELTAYTSRYDLDSGTWGAREPHVTELGESAMLMPRLGADSQGNLMLVWAVGAETMQLVYRRYDAAAGEWGEIQAIPESSFSDATFATEGKLPFGFGRNGLGGVLFRTDVEGGTQSLKLASFY